MPGKAKNLDSQSSTTVVQLKLGPDRDAEKTKANKMYNNWTYHVKVKMSVCPFARFVHAANV